MRTKTLKSTGTFQSQHTKLLQQTDQISYTSTNHTKRTLFDFSLPWDTRINEKYGEKVSKYLPLASAIKHQMNLKSVTIQPIIVGCLGSFSNRMKTELQNLHINITLEQLQVTVIEESSKILRFVLNID